MVFRASPSGQVLVVGGILFALALLALATVLNAAVFTDELATRETAVGEDDALGYRAAVEDGVGGRLYYANYRRYDDKEALYEAVTASVANWSRLAGRHYAASRVRATAVRTGVTNGSYVFQAGHGAFTTADGDGNWTLVRDVGGLRRFSLNVSRSALEEPDGTGTVADLAGAGTFRVRTTNGSATARAFVYRDDDAVVVRVEGPSGLRDGRCAVDGTDVTVAITAATVGDTDCEQLEALRLDGPTDLRYRNGDAAAGRYGLVTDVPATDLDEGPYAPGTTGPDPHAVPAIYAVTLDVDYAVAELRYTTETRVAPETPPQHRTYGVAPGPGLTGRTLVLVDPADGGLRTVAPNGSVAAYDATGVQAIAPLSTGLDGDGRPEVPYVDSAGTLKLVDAANETRTVASGAAQSKTLLGVGTWGNATFERRTAVFYVNTSDSTIYRAWYDGSTDTYERQLVRQNDGDGDGIAAIAGIADYNDDGDTDIVFTDGSQLVTYVDGGRTHETDENVGQNNGIGIGEPRDFDGDGDQRAPIVNPSNNVALLPESGTSEDRTSSGPATKAPVAGVEWDGTAGGREVVFVDTSQGTLHYVTASGDIVEVTDATGDPIRADDDQGVA